MAMFSATKPPTGNVIEALVAVMPHLAGRPLEAPKFFETNWKVGQEFSERDDPDRTREHWTPPDFSKNKDLFVQSKKTRSEELHVMDTLARETGTKMPDTFARVVRGALDEEHCAELLSKVNAKGFTPALINTGGGRQELLPEYRDGHRIIVDSPDLAAWLLEVLRPHLPARMGDLSLAGLNERCRFLCYTPGQSFPGHTDGCYKRRGNHPKAGEQSRVTVQLYLHDVPKDHGGATTFYPDSPTAVGHQPEAGSVLLFTQDLFHEGSLLEKGLKYTLRTEAMYSREPISQEPQWPLALVAPTPDKIDEPSNNGYSRSPRTPPRRARSTSREPNRPSRQRRQEDDRLDEML